MDELERRMNRLEDSMATLAADIAQIKGSQQTVELLLKWVILPLIVIVGGVVGIKLVIPGA